MVDREEMARNLVAIYCGSAVRLDAAAERLEQQDGREEDVEAYRLAARIAREGQ